MIEYIKDKVINIQKFIERKGINSIKLINLILILKRNPYIKNNINFNELLFNEIPLIINDKFYIKIIKDLEEIEEIEKINNEYLIGNYFSEIKIVDFIFKEININLKEDGIIPKMIDINGGCGSFTSGYIRFMNDKYKNVINWQNQINNITINDIRIDALKIANIEVFYLLGDIYLLNNDNYNYNNYKYDYLISNLCLYDDYDINKINNLKLMKYIKCEIKTLNDKDKIKIRKEQLKEINNEIKKDNIEIDKILLLLKENGRAILIIKNLILFHKKYKYLREIILFKYKLKDVIRIDDERSLLIIDNNKNDMNDYNITFSYLKLFRYENDIFKEFDNKLLYLEHLRDSIKDVQKEIIFDINISLIKDNKLLSLDYYNYYFNFQ